MEKHAISRVTAIALIVIVVVVAVAAYYIYATILARPAVTPIKEIKVGMIHSFTGSLAVMGTQVAEGCRIAVEMANDWNILPGAKLTYVMADARSDPTVAKTETERLITMEGVDFVIGTYGSAIMLTASEACERYEKVYWEVMSVTDKATLRGFKYFLRFFELGGDLGPVSVKFVADVIAPKLGVKPSDLKVAIIFEDGPFGSSAGEGNRLMAEKYGMKIVLYEGYSSAATDLSYLVLKLKEAKPDVILAASYLHDCILFLRQAKEMGLKVKAIVGQGGGWVVAPDLPKAIGDDVNYIIVTGVQVGTNPPETVNVDGLLPKVKEAFLEFVKRYKQKFGLPPPEFSNNGFAGSWVMFSEVLPRVLEKYGEVTSENILKAAWELDIPMGGTARGHGCKFSTPASPSDTDIGKLAGRNQPHVGQNTKAHAFIAQWSNQQLYVIWPEQFAARTAVIPLPPTSPYSG
ncbi:MAG: ABC transporter substrate-binding protein [Candidatus Bathyarchaeia archaeon]